MIGVSHLGLRAKGTSDLRSGGRGAKLHNPQRLGQRRGFLDGLISRLPLLLRFFPRLALFPPFALLLPPPFAFAFLLLPLLLHARTRFLTLALIRCPVGRFKLVAHLLVIDKQIADHL